MPTSLTSSENRAASLRAQAATSREFPLAEPPADPGARALWLQHAAGFLLVNQIRAAGLATLEQDAPAGVRSAVELAIDATLYALLMHIDGVAGGPRGSEYAVALTAGVTLMRGDAVVAQLDLRDGDGMCMGFHGWTDGDYGAVPVVPG